MSLLMFRGHRSLRIDVNLVECGGGGGGDDGVAGN